jgi:hypothetical protein
VELSKLYKSLTSEAITDCTESCDSFLFECRNDLVEVGTSVLVRSQSFQTLKVFCRVSLEGSFLSLKEHRSDTYITHLLGRDRVTVEVVDSKGLHGIHWHSMRYSQ